MKLYISHSSNFDFKNKLYIPLRNSMVNVDNDIFLPHESEECINTKEIIKESEIVIAEVSYPSIGVGIELGWANDANVKIICLHKEDSRISNSLKVVSDTFISYSDITDMINKLSTFLLTVK